MGLINHLFGKRDRTIALLENVIDIQADQARKRNAQIDSLHGAALDFDAQITDLHERADTALNIFMTRPSVKRMNKADCDAILAALTGE